MVVAEMSPDAVEYLPVPTPPHTYSVYGQRIPNFYCISGRRAHELFIFFERVLKVRVGSSLAGPLYWLGTCAVPICTGIRAGETRHETMHLYIVLGSRSRQDFSPPSNGQPNVLARLRRLA